MARISDHGLGVEPPKGWDAQIYVREPDPAAVASAGAAGVAGAAGAGTGEDETKFEVHHPIVHLANFGLPAGRADLGGGAVELMGPGGVFISIVEYDPADASSALFANEGVPWPLSADDFAPDQLQRMLDGQAGCQRFFTHKRRAYCLYVVLGSNRQRALLVREVNAALAGVDLG